MWLLAAADSEESFWVQLLVVVILACGAGVYTYAKSRAKRVRRYNDDAVIETLIESPSPLPQTEGKQFRFPRPASIRAAAKPAASVRFEFPAPARKSRVTNSGMELLAVEFLVGIVERIDALEKPDIAMRSMCWKELSRRGRLDAISSDSLKSYILNEGGFFDKSIRTEAMAQLACRTEAD